MFKGHPKGLIAAALSNMGERFGYYIMNAVLLLFLCSKFGISDNTAAIIYAVFYFAIYVLSLPGGIIADKLQNYKGTIMVGLLTMAAGYVILSVPLMGNITDPSATTGILVLTCVALFIIAFGNGLFKGNLQALVGQMYDNLEAEAAKKGPEELAKAQSKRDPGFQIFYVFINIGGVIAPFIAPTLRQWWLGLKGMTYNADLPALCHQYLADPAAMTPEQAASLQTLMEQVNQGGLNLADMHASCVSYLDVFNTGVHYSFIASVAAMLISLVIFLLTKKGMPEPQKKAAATTVDHEKAVDNMSREDREKAAKDIKQRMMGLYAVLGVCVFFWMAFHQNGQSLSLFARNFVNSDSVAPEVWQFLNPALVILLTPVIMWLFGTQWGRKFSTPRKIALGMGFVVCAYLFLTVLCAVIGYPNGTDYLAQDVSTRLPKSGAWVLIVTYFFLTVAELFISPLGLSFVSKIAPKHIQGICQGLWLSATAIGNLLIMVGPFLFNELPSLWMCWLVFMIISFVAMLIMFGMLKWLERITTQNQ